jgi:hypothetical protein
MVASLKSRFTRPLYRSADGRAIFALKGLEGSHSEWAHTYSSKFDCVKNRKAASVRRTAINIFISFHLVAITSVALPVDFAPVEVVREYVRPYFLWAGLFQRWDMFAPDPPAINSYIRTVVISHDRHMRVWSFPRMEELGFGERYRKERYRKFSDVLPQPQMALLWPDVARHVAGQFDSQTGSIDKVLLIEFQSEIRPGLAPDPPFTPSIFYEDYVHPEKLP